MSQAVLLERQVEEHSNWFDRQQTFTEVAKVMVPALPSLNFLAGFPARYIDLDREAQKHFRGLVEPAVGQVVLRAFTLPSAGSRESLIYHKRACIIGHTSDKEVVSLSQIRWLITQQAGGQRGFLSTDGGVTLFYVPNPKRNLEERLDDGTIGIAVRFLNRRIWQVAMGDAILNWASGRGNYLCNRIVRAF